MLKNKIITQTFKILFFRVLGVCLLFGLTLYLTNNYEAKIIGRYDFVRSFLLVIGSICLLGTDLSILYFSGKLNSEENIIGIKYIYFKMIRMIFISSIIPIIGIIIIGKNIVNVFFEDNSSYLLLLNSVFILFFYCLTILNTEFFRALNLTVLSEVFRNIVKYLPVFLSAVILSIVGKEDLLISFFLLGFVFVALISTFLVFRQIKKLDSLRKKRKETILTKEIFLTSYPMAISNMGFFLLLSIDIVFLKKYESDEIVAYYSVAVKFVLILSMIINAININVSSSIAELFKAQRILELNKLLIKSSRLIFFLSLPLILIIVFFSENILKLFGNDYLISKTALLIMVISQGICTLFGSVTVYLNMTGKQNILQNILICSVGINFILNRILIPDYGMIGAAIAFSCSLFFWNILATVIIYKKDKVRTFLKL